MWVIGMERKVHNHEILSKKYLEQTVMAREKTVEAWY